jgi:outer membrane murein-binding lipoprotein Lpp
MRTWLSSHPRWTLALTALVAMLVGVGIGAAGSQTELDELERDVSKRDAQIAGLERKVAAAARGAERARSEVADRLESVERRERDLRTREEEQRERLADEEREQRSRLAERRRELNERERRVSSAEAARERSKITDGIWQRGRDFEPGLYRAPGGDGCYWAKLNSASTNDIAENGGFSTNQTLQIDSPFFQTNECGEWVKIG